MADEHSKINEQAEMTNNLKAEEKIVPDILEKVLDKEHLWKSGEYVRSLRDRLGQCVQRNNEDILESVKLLQELCEVSDTTLTSSTNTPRIKHLIRNFETIAAANGADLGKQSTDVPEIRSLLLKFKTLNDEDSLRDCLMTFKSAKEKFEKLHSFLANSDGATTEPARSAPAPEAKKLSPSNSVSPTNSVSPSLREKIVAFNKALGDGRETSKYFMDCFSSRCSFHDPMPETSVEDMKPPINPWSRTNSGYEGDMESEVEQSDNLEGQAD